MAIKIAPIAIGIAPLFHSIALFSATTKFDRRHGTQSTLISIWVNLDGCVLPRLAVDVVGVC